ncbi:MAG: hypothetical protein AAB459_01330 [Patescibacteria group bacterium]
MMLDALHRFRGSFAPNGGVNAESGEMQPPPTVFHDQVAVGRHQVDVSLAVPHPSKRKYNGWALIEPGFGGFMASSEKLMLTMAAMGVATACYEPVRSDHENLLFSLIKPQAIHTDTVAAISDNLPNNNRLISEVPEIKAIDLRRLAHLPHSMGGHPAKEFAENSPNKTDMVVGMAIVGMGSPTIPQLMRNLPAGLPRGIFMDLLPGIYNGSLDLNIKNAIKVGRYFAQNPFRTAGEAISCLTADFRPAFRALGSTGIHTAFVGFGNDSLINPNPAISEEVDVFTVIPNTGHMAPQVRPHLVADTVVSVMTNPLMQAA